MSNQIPNHSEERQPSHDWEQQKSAVLARLRAYGPAFDHEIECECFVPVPDLAVVIAALVASGYCIETIRCFREAYPGGPRQWLNLRVLWVRLEETGKVVPTPVLPGAGRCVELWQSAEEATAGGVR